MNAIAMNAICRTQSLLSRRNILLSMTGIAVSLALAFVIGAFSASAAGDRTPPTKPTNFRVTAVTPFSVSLAWSPSTDNSKNFTYFLNSSAGGATTLPKTATSYTFNGLRPGSTYQFIIYAFDAAGNKSGTVGVLATVPPDTIAPSTAPVVSVTGVGATYVSLSWTPSQDNGPFLFYTVFVNGVAYGSPVTNTSLTVNFLQPETTYSIQVRAADYGNNLSPISAAVSATTSGTDTGDTTPPSMPGNLTDNGMSFPDGETWLFWQQSTDNVDPQAVLRYDVYANGVLDHSLIGGGFTILYGNPGGPNTYQVIAVDTSGNQSVPATITTTP
jgi:chitodextrinase